MKKILSIPLIFTVLLSLIPLLPSRAANIPTSEQVSTANAFYNTVNDDVCSLDNILSQLNDPQNYIYFNSLYFGSNGRAYIKTYFCLLDESSEYDPTVELSDNDTLYTVSCDSSQGLHCWYTLSIFSSDYSIISASSSAVYSSSGFYITSFYVDTTSSYCDLFDRYETEILVGDVVACLDGSILGSDLNVDVSFNPVLSGDVDRSFTAAGNTALLSELNMFVRNRSRFPIQYKMSIFKANQSNIRPVGLDINDTTAYDDDPVFIYYTQGWAYTNRADTNGSLVTDVGYLTNKANMWHRVAKDDNDSVFIQFSQINLKEGESYRVVVHAIKCPYDNPSNVFVQYPETAEAVYPELHQLNSHDIQVVYDSTFTMLQYNDVKYDPNDSRGGVLPFNGDQGYLQVQNYEQSRDAIVNDDGSIDYSSHNFYEQRQQELANYYSSGSSKSYNSVISQSSGVFAFISSVLSFFPSSILIIFNLGFWSIVIIAIIKKVS